MLYIDNLHCFVKVIIDNQLNGTFHPQNKVLVNTSLMVNEIAKFHRRKIYLIKGFDTLISKLSEHSNLLQKVFGTLFYDSTLEGYPESIFNKAGLTVDVLCGYPREYTQKNEKIPVNEKIDDMTVYRKKYIQLGRKNFLSRLINYFSFTFTILLNVRMCRNYKTIIVYSNPPILPLIKKTLWK